MSSGLHIAHLIDHLVFACALYRMKIASASIATEMDAYLAAVLFEAVLVDNPAILSRKPAARLIFVDTSWFQDEVEYDVGQRSHARRDADTRWTARITCLPDEPRPPIIVATTAGALESQLLTYWLSFGTDWERMVSVVSLTSTNGFTLALVALSLGRTVCLANPDIARNLVATYVHHYLVATTQELSPLVARQGTAFVPMPSLHGAYVEGTSFAPALVSECMATVSPNTTFAYTHPQIGTIAFGHAGQIRNTPGAVGFVTPWAEVEIVGNGDMPVAAEQEGRLRFRRRAAAGATAAANEWLYPGQRGRRPRTTS